METKNAIIKDAVIKTDGGILTVWVTLNYDAFSQAFGGYALYVPKSFTNHEVKSVAGHFIYRVMEIAGAKQWSDVVGKTIRARCDDSKIYSIGHIVKDDWFSPKDDFACKEDWK